MAQQDEQRTLQPIERGLAAAAHLVALLGYIIPIGTLVVGNVVAPLGMWLGLRRQSRFVGQHARESTNFQITISLFLLLDHLLFRRLGGGEAVFLFVIVYSIIVVILAAHKAYRGEGYKYTLSLPYLR